MYDLWFQKRKDINKLEGHMLRMKEKFSIGKKKLYKSKLIFKNLFHFTMKQQKPITDLLTIIWEALFSKGLENRESMRSLKSVPHQDSTWTGPPDAVSVFSFVPRCILLLALTLLYCSIFVVISLHPCIVNWVFPTASLIHNTVLDTELRRNANLVNECMQ